jgi:hypothetical protein
MEKTEFKLLHKGIDFAPYRYRVELVVWDSDKPFTDPRYPNLQHEDVLGTACFGQIDTGKQHREPGVVLLFQAKAITYGIIAHECLHAVNMIFNAINYRPRMDNDESQTYALEYLVDWVVAAILEEGLAIEVNSPS